MSVDHYENFPVASWLCPPALRAPIRAIYHFARTADDLADEGDAAPAQRLADLASYRGDLEAVLCGREPSRRWRAVFEPLRGALLAHRLPAAPLRDLLSAFEQDVTQQDYADRAGLLDYCRRSADPVGRLLLHLYGVDDDRSLARSDAICTSLQLINFWQDLGVDAARGRVYLPRADLARHGITLDDVRARRDSPALRAAVADACQWARALMLDGSPLVHTLPGRAGLELRFVVQGGLRVLDRIAALGHATIAHRPTLGWRDALPLLVRAVAMRRPATDTTMPRTAR